MTLERFKNAKKFHSCGDIRMLLPIIEDVEEIAEYLRLQVIPGRAVVFDHGVFRSPHDYLKHNPVIYPGSFNPIHEAHARVGRGTLFEITINHYFKGPLDLIDVAHRIKMINLHRCPVLVMHAASYVDKHMLLKSYIDQPYVYRIGSDAFNECTNEGSRMFGDTALTLMEDATFEIVPRDGIGVNDNETSRRLATRIVNIDRPKNTYSRHVRDGNFQNVGNNVRNYIRANNLYSSSDPVGDSCGAATD